MGGWGSFGRGLALPRLCLIFREKGPGGTRSPEHSVDARSLRPDFYPFGTTRLLRVRTSTVSTTVPPPGTPPRPVHPSSPGVEKLPTGQEVLQLENFVHVLHTRTPPPVPSDHLHRPLLPSRWVDCKSSPPCRLSYLTLDSWTQAPVQGGGWRIGGPRSPAGPWFRYLLWFTTRDRERVGVEQNPVDRLRVG